MKDKWETVEVRGEIIRIDGHPVDIKRWLLLTPRGRVLAPLYQSRSTGTTLAKKAFGPMRTRFGVYSTGWKRSGIPGRIFGGAELR